VKRQMRGLVQSIVAALNRAAGEVLRPQALPVVDRS
jgi:hypothetical protein